MSGGYVAERILKPDWWTISPLKRGRGKRAVSVIGFDSEQDTETATPMLFQFSRFGTADAVELVELGIDADPLAAFMRYVHETCTNKATEYIILGWNMAYEFTQIFARLPLDISAEPEFVLDYELRDVSGNAKARYTLTVANDKRYFVRIRNESTHRTVTFADGMAFYVTSLDKAAAMLGLGRKLDMVTKKFTRRDLRSETFREYARQDAYLTRLIGENILDLHVDFDVTTCLTAPQFATKVFKHHFLDGTIPPPDPVLEQAGLYAYHGGKNGYYLAEPASIPNIYAYDITSAYPEAMRQLPDVARSQWHWTLGYEKGVHALWNIRADYRSCKYHGLQRHDGKWHETGPIEGWTTSYELDAAIERGEIDVTDCEGWVMRGDPGGALMAYVDTFFARKRKSKGAEREASKLFLNSLYGKFFQKVPLGIVGSYALDENGEFALDSYVTTDPSQEHDYQAGGLYHPPIAALITGFVRAKIHRLEHKYDAIMTSTDGFFARRPPDPADVGTDLGSLTVERGHLRIWRERLYDFAPSRLHAIETRARPKHKFALHGFRGKLADLTRIPLRPGKYGYRATQMMTNKLARNAFGGTRYRPGTFVELAYILKLDAERAPP